MRAAVEPSNLPPDLAAWAYTGSGTGAEHKAITARLKVATAHVENAQQIWKAYQDAYVDHPSWLDAIKT